MPDTPTLNRPAVEGFMTALGVDGYSDLARRSGIERSYLSRIMRGERPAKPSHILAIARALQQPPIAVMGPADPAEAEASLRAHAEVAEAS